MALSQRWPKQKQVGVQYNIGPSRKGHPGHKVTGHKQVTEKYIMAGHQIAKNNWTESQVAKHGYEMQ